MHGPLMQQGGRVTERELESTMQEGKVYSKSTLLYTKHRTYSELHNSCHLFPYTLTIQHAQLFSQQMWT